MKLPRQLLAEWRKSLHPITAVLIATVAGATVAFSFSTERFATDQTPVAAINSVLLEQNVAAKCLTDVADHSSECVNSRINHASDQRFRKGGVRLGAVARAIQSSFPGSLSFAAGGFATGLGWLLVVGLTALLVAGEWQGGLITSTLLANPRIGRFMIAKTFAVWATACIGMLGAGLLLGTAHTLFSSRFPIVRAPNVRGMTRAQLEHLANIGMVRGGVDPVRADTHWSSTGFAIERLVGAGAVLLAFAGLAVALAVVIRRQLPLLLAGATILALVTQTHALGTLSPLNVIGAVMDSARTPFGIQDHFLWKLPGAMRNIYDSPHPPGLSVAALLGWSLVVTGAASAAYWRLTTRDRI
jgi:hypothetical protein